jgi:hypothetical protein
MQTIQGFRRNLTDALVANCPGFGARRERTENLARINGYLASLYVMRMESLPPAYVRSPEVKAVQDQIDAAIARICEWRDSKLQAA